MSIFTKKDFDQISSGVPIGYILQDHLKNASEVKKFYTNFFYDPNKQWSDDVKNFMNLLNAAHDYNGTDEFTFTKNNVSIKVILKKSINNIPELKVPTWDAFEENLLKTYPELKVEVISAIHDWYQGSALRIPEQFVELWNLQLQMNHPNMILEAPAWNIPNSTLTLVFPKKYLIGEYDD